MDRLFLVQNIQRLFLTPLNKRSFYNARYFQRRTQCLALNFSFT
jgi:hypothetical protein